MTNEKQVEDALKLALEALEKLRMSSWAELKAAFEYADLAIPCIREALADSALERMAENARELGLDYEPAPVAKPHEQQEPAFYIVEPELDALLRDGRRAMVLYTEPITNGIDVPVYTSPPASKQWVGLTDEEIGMAFRKAFPVGGVDCRHKFVPLVIHKPLTDEQIDKLEWAPSYGNPLTLAEGLRLFAREVEAAHGIKGDA